MYMDPLIYRIRIYIYYILDLKTYIIIYPVVSEPIVPCLLRPAQDIPSGIRQEPSPGV